MARKTLDTVMGNLPDGIAKPATRALAGAGITRLAQLANISEAKLAQLHGVGPKAIGIIRDALKKQGMSFAKND